jgi:hypothetical protein
MNHSFVTSNNPCSWILSAWVITSCQHILVCSFLLVYERTGMVLRDNISPICGTLWMVIPPQVAWRKRGFCFSCVACPPETRCGSSDVCIKGWLALVTLPSVTCDQMWELRCVCIKGWQWLALVTLPSVTWDQMWELRCVCIKGWLALVTLPSVTWDQMWELRCLYQGMVGPSHLVISNLRDEDPPLSSEGSSTGLSAAVKKLPSLRGWRLQGPLMRVSSLYIKQMLDLRFLEPWLQETSPGLQRLIVCLLHSSCWFLLGVHFDPEDGGSIFLRNITWLLP